MSAELTFAETTADIRRTMDEAASAMRRAKSRIDELELSGHRLVQLIEDTQANSEGQWPRHDPGCIDCTAGTVPDSRNSGRCAYHDALKILGLTAGMQLPRLVTANQLLECLMQASLNEERASLCHPSQHEIRTFLLTNARLLKRIAGDDSALDEREVAAPEQAQKQPRKRWQGPGPATGDA